MPEDKKTSNENDKIMGVLAYVGILVVIPLFAGGNSKFVKYHANQGLVLFIAMVLTNILWVIPFLGWVAAPAVGLLILVLAIMGIINVVNNEMKPLPLIGGIKLIK
ncbi:MAG: hypothetical protein NT111_01465 [Patescibacteria group bacterium]|nr:hypothetical protein [Patescibacteria group bacterium]